ncbi:MAG: hypothetical protein J7K14_05115 [Sulfurimonas sp.]|nr:hypothetical protein [Sulfurimonas sp.]
MSLVKKITDWMLEKETEMAKSCSIPMREIEYQIDKVALEKQKIQQKYDEAMVELNDVAEKLEKIKNIEIFRCSNK